MRNILQHQKGVVWNSYFKWNVWENVAELQKLHTSSPPCTCILQKSLLPTTCLKNTFYKFKKHFLKLDFLGKLFQNKFGKKPLWKFMQWCLHLLPVFINFSIWLFLITNLAEGDCNFINIMICFKKSYFFFILMEIV